MKTLYYMAIKHLYNCSNFKWKSFVKFITVSCSLNILFLEGFSKCKIHIHIGMFCISFFPRMRKNRNKNYEIYTSVTLYLRE